MIHRSVVNNKSKVTNKQKNRLTADILPPLATPAASVSCRYSSFPYSESCRLIGMLVLIPVLFCDCDKLSTLWFTKISATSRA